MPNPKYTNKEVNFKKSNILGNRIQKLRSDKNWSQNDLALKLCEVMDQEEAMKPLTISSYETGKRLPTLPTLLGLSQLFEVSVDYLLGADISDNKAKITKIVTNDDDNAQASPILELDAKIPVREYEKYHGQPVFVKSSGSKPFISRWGLLDYYKKEVIFVENESINLTSEYELYNVKPSITSVLESEGIYVLNLGQLMKLSPESFVWVELLNADAETKGLYRGYYRHNSHKSCLIGTNGLTLPYSGLGISYNAYFVENAR